MRTPHVSIVVLAWLGGAALAATAAAQPTGGTEPARPAAAPAARPEDAPSAPPEPAATTDVDALRQEVEALRDELFRSRARAAAVAGALYSSKLRVVLHHTSGRHHTVTRASVRLDGASVYDDDQGAVSKGPAPRFEGFVAPGRHVVTIRLEATAKDDERFTTATESTFVVQVPKGKDVVVTATAKDDGDIAYAWKRDEAGSYKLGIDVGIKTTARATGRPAAARSSGHPTERDVRRRAQR